MTERGRDGVTGAAGAEGRAGTTGATGERGPEGKRGRDTNNPAVWALAFALVLCFSLLAIANRRNHEAVQVATHALCSEKIDISTRLRQTNEFIRRMDGAKSITIGSVTYSRADLMGQQHQLKRQNDNLKDVKCG